jgi:uncharacterized membrane protein
MTKIQENIEMAGYDHTSISIPKPTLALSGTRAYVSQTFLIGIAIVLPLIAHLTGAPVRYLLPMHWPVILAGLIYGWRSGALIGLLAPVVNYLLSGFPLPAILPSMTVELLTYGLVAGLLRERFSMSAWLAVTLALIAGRLVFIISVFIAHVVTSNYLGYFIPALLPGLVAGLGQILFLPMLAQWWVKQEQRNRIITERDHQSADR